MANTNGTEPDETPDGVDPTAKRSCPSSSFDCTVSPLSNALTNKNECLPAASRATKASLWDSLWDASYGKRISILAWLLFSLCILGGGFGVGWAIGKQKTASQLRVDEMKPSGLRNDKPVSEGDRTVSNSLTETGSPTEYPTGSPIAAPTATPTTMPTTPPTTTPTTPTPTTPPTTTPTTPTPTKAPTTPPTMPPVSTKAPIVPPTTPPINPPTMSPTQITYVPGKLTRMENNLLLSEGLLSRVIAQSGDPVNYSGGTTSEIGFHVLPDAGGTFPDTRWWNPGGWIYVSNSEAKNETEGGVGAITFTRNGKVIDYRMVLEDTYMNCGGGRTPWNTWVSCEEIEFTGKIYQVDPTGQRPAEVMTLGSDGGRWESFAYDVRDKLRPRFFSTEDHNKGCTRRFTPDVVHWGGDEWKMLHEEGVVDYLLIIPNVNRTGGTFVWTDDIQAAKSSAKLFYPQSEGIDVQDGIMYIVCKKIQQLFIFDLDRMIFRNVSTVSGLFDGNPDQMQRILGKEGGLLYFTEEGGKDAGIHARDNLGRFFTILESPIYSDETTGLSFSPDGKHLYIAYQENGILFDVFREDGLPFDAKSLDVKYHNSISSRRLNSQWVGL